MRRNHLIAATGPPPSRFEAQTGLPQHGNCLLTQPRPVENLPASPTIHLNPPHVDLFRRSLGLSLLPYLCPITWEKVRNELRWAALFAGVAGLVAGPLLVHYALHPEHFFLRSNNLSIFDPARSRGDPLAALLINVWKHLSVFGLGGDPHWRQNYAGQPMLNPAEAVFFWFGLGMAVWRWRWPVNRLLLIWLVTMIFPAFLSGGAPPNTMRMLGAAPAVYLIMGMGIWEALRYLRKRVFPKKGTGTAIAAGLVISVAILVQGTVTYRTYFHKWANAPEVRANYFGHGWKCSKR